VDIRDLVSIPYSLYVLLVWSVGHNVVGEPYAGNSCEYRLASKCAHTEDSGVCVQKRKVQRTAETPILRAHKVIASNTYHHHQGSFLRPYQF
jgi:hypothetical protein